jgi:hypothetical protein
MESGASRVTPEGAALPPNTLVAHYLYLWELTAVR